ncbi:hypothetical protein D3C71_2140290 [compost metagenome]
MRGAVRMVMAKVATAMPPSMREIAKSRRIARGLTRLATAAITIAASADCGTW